MSTPNGATAAEVYWRSVHEAHSGPTGEKQRRAGELLRLRRVADAFRAEFLPDLPAITISCADFGGRVNAGVDPLGAWGQGVSIQLKTSRVDPFNTTGADMGLPPTGGDRSLLFGHQLLHTQAGEELRCNEADLLVFQQLVRAFQYLVEERKLPGHGAASTDLKSYEGNGDWFAGQCNRVWETWAPRLGLVFVPVRHGRQLREIKSPLIQEPIAEDQAFSFLRPSCARWPFDAMRIARELPRDQPECIEVDGDKLLINDDQWERWQRDQVAVSTATTKYLGGKELLHAAVAWPAGEAPLIDEIGNGEEGVSFPTVMKAIAMSSKLTINYNAADALQSVEALFTDVDKARGTTLWPEFLQLAANHPQAPGATRVQQALAIDLDEEPAPVPVASMFDQVAAFLGHEATAEDAEYLLGVMQHEWDESWEDSPSKPSRIDPEPEPPVRIDRHEPMVTASSPFHLEQVVSHEAFGRGPVIKLFNDGVAVAFPKGKMIVKPESLTLVEPGELPVDEAVVQATEAADQEPAAAQSQLRKLPEWPAGRARSTATGQRARLTGDQTAVLEQAIRDRLTAFPDLKGADLASELSPWCGQGESALQQRIRTVRKELQP